MPPSITEGTVPTKRAKHQKHQAAYNSSRQLVRLEDVTREGGPYYADVDLKVPFVVREYKGGKKKVLAYRPGRSPEPRRIRCSKDTPHGWCIKDLTDLVNGQLGITVRQFDGQVLLQPQVLLEAGRDFYCVLDERLREKRDGRLCRPDIQVRYRGSNILVCIIEVRWSSGVSAENKAFYSRLGVNVVQISARTWAKVRGTPGPIPVELAWGPIAATTYRQFDLFEPAAAASAPCEESRMPQRVSRSKKWPGRAKATHTNAFRVHPAVINSGSKGITRLH